MTQNKRQNQKVIMWRWEWGVDSLTQGLLVEVKTRQRI